MARLVGSFGSSKQAGRQEISKESKRSNYNFKLGQFHNRERYTYDRISICRRTLCSATASVMNSYYSYLKILSFIPSLSLYLGSKATRKGLFISKTYGES